MSLISWHTHEDFQHLIHLHQKRFYYQGTVLSGKYTLREIEYMVLDDVDALHLIWHDIDCVFVDWKIHPSFYRYLQKQASHLLEFMEISDLQPAKKIKITTNRLLVPSNIFLGVSFMEDNNNWHYRTPNKEELKLALLELR